MALYLMASDNFDRFIELFDWSNQLSNLSMMIRKDFDSQWQLEPVALPSLKPILMIIDGRFQRMNVVALPGSS